MKRKFWLVCVLVSVVLCACSNSKKPEEITPEEEFEYEFEIKERQEKEEYKKNCAREKSQIEMQSLENLYKFDKNDVADVFVGKNRIFLVTKSGELYGWGEAYSKEDPYEITESQVRNSDLDVFLCGSDNLSQDKVCGRKYIPVPVKMNISFIPKEVVSLDKGAIALSDNGEIYLWGNQEYNIGAGTNYVTPVKFEASKAVKIYNVDETLYFIDEEGQVHGNEFSYGHNKLYFESGVMMPRGKIKYFEGQKVKEMLFTKYEMIARTENDDFFYIPTYGGKVDTRYKNMLINRDKKIKQLIDGGEELFALYNNGEISKIKRKRTSKDFEYYEEKLDINNEKFSVISADKDGRFFVTDKGEVYAASVTSGDNTKNNFAKIPFPEKIKTVKTCDYNQIFVGESGNIYVCGENTAGQKLDGTRRTSSICSCITK